MVFTKRLRDPIMRGEITGTDRIWQRPRVIVGGNYPLGNGIVQITSIREITPADLTPELAQHSGFSDVPDLLETAQYAAGDNIYLVEFKYHG